MECYILIIFQKNKRRITKINVTNNNIFYRRRIKRYVKWKKVEIKFDNKINSNKLIFELDKEKKMANKIICDICEMREANVRIKAKKSDRVRNRKVGNLLDYNSFWKFYENIDICNNYYDKIFSKETEE